MMEHKDSPALILSSPSSASAGGAPSQASPVPILPMPLTSTPLHPHMSQDSVNTSSSSIAGRVVKARRKTTTPADLLFAGGPITDSRPAGSDPPVLAVAPLRPQRDVTPDDSSTKSSATNSKAASGGEGATRRSSPADSNLMPPPKTMPTKGKATGGSYTQLPRTESGPGRPDPSPSPSLQRKSLPGATAKPEPSPSMRRKMTNSTSSGSLSRQGSVGVITPAANRTFRTNPLIHSHTAVGHSKAVLSVYATEDLMFSSSKDRTAKVWDLETGEEVLTLDGHPNNVVCVRYNEETSLAYTASTYFVKVWDVRQGNTCITTVMSSGLTTDVPIPASSTTSRQVTCPPGEMDIKDIALNSTGGVLYTAAGNTVRIWDCRTWKSVGKLSGGHQAAVMVLAVDDTDTADGNICVVTGSKDHYIKVFEVMEDSTGVICPKFNLEPPHYDGIQSLCLMGDLLYSGSRDMCIKKWDLADQSLKQSINNAHKDWICGLAFMPGGNCLLSGCRGGYLKLWHIDNCSMLGEIKAHSSPINAVTTNSQMIFTASNDRSIHIWKSRLTPEELDSPENE